MRGSVCHDQLVLSLDTSCRGVRRRGLVDHRWGLWHMDRNLMRRHIVRSRWLLHFLFDNLVLNRLVVHMLRSVVRWSLPIFILNSLCLFLGRRLLLLIGFIRGPIWLISLDCVLLGLWNLSVVLNLSFLCLRRRHGLLFSLRLGGPGLLLCILLFVSATPGQEFLVVEHLLL